MKTEMSTYGIGARVFCDFHLGGKPRGKVVEVVTPGTGKDSTGKVRVKLTETVGAYKQGEVLTISSFQAVPVKQELKLKRGQFFRRVNTCYQYV